MEYGILIAVGEEGYFQIVGSVASVEEARELIQGYVTIGPYSGFVPPFEFQIHRMTRDEIWSAAVAFADAHMRDAGRKSWDDSDWAAMVEEFDRLCPPLELIPTAVIRAEVNKRLAAESPKHKTLRPCAGCGAMLGARERRKACPKCGKRNPRK